jgi:hypothetical protein
MIEVLQGFFHIIQSDDFLAEHFCASFPRDKCSMGYYNPQLPKNGAKALLFSQRFGQCLTASSARASMYSLHWAGSFMSRSSFRMISSSSVPRAFIGRKPRGGFLKESPGGDMKLL